MSDSQDQRPEEPRKPGRIQTRSRHKRALIVAAAMKVFARYGLSKTTIEDIARQAGIGKATLYYHFDGKEALIRFALSGLTHPNNPRMLPAPPTQRYPRL